MRALGWSRFDTKAPRQQHETTLPFEHEGGHRNAEGHVATGAEMVGNEESIPGTGGRQSQKLKRGRRRTGGDVLLRVLRGMREAGELSCEEDAGVVLLSCRYLCFSCGLASPSHAAAITAC